MYYLIQENVFRDLHYNRIIEAVQRLELPYEIVHISGEREDFEFQTDRKDVFCFGGMKMARVAKEMDWNPGSLMNENHDFDVYASIWGAHLLNGDSVVQSMLTPVSFTGGPRFIRPTKDSKRFTGRLFSETEWQEFLTEWTETHPAEDFAIQVATPKKIFQEIRCWVVDEKIVSASTYKVGDQVVYREYQDPDGLAFATEMAAVFQPARAFVMDICRTPAGWKIVEINCINSAGFYACDLQKLLFHLENAFG